ncbi:hypothetical protein C0993_008380 [Termitomyces sp. T159_Od127]|nr:hypothetical protein C0993_008380 [Termitomyces sp. T159_Od127]
MSALNARLWDELSEPSVAKTATLVYGKQSNGLDLGDALDHGQDFDIFSTLATHLCATALSPDTLSAHLPSQSLQTLLLCTTLPSSSAPVNTLVNSGTANNFIDESLAMLAATHWRLPIPIHLTLFNSSSTSASDITHYIGQLLGVVAQSHN